MAIQLTITIPLQLSIGILKRLKEQQMKKESQFQILVTISNIQKEEILKNRSYKSSLMNS